jgi:hypothetical protein
VDITYEEALRYAAGPGANFVIGAVLMFVLEMWPEFDALESRLKRLAALGVCMVVPVGASALGCLSFGWEFSHVTFFPAVMAGLAAFGSSQMAHILKLQPRTPPMQLGRALLEMYEQEMVKNESATRGLADKESISERMLRLVGSYYYNG